MIGFKISAPGRIILSGDHTMMYGRKVVAAGLDLRSKLQFYETSNNENISINYPDIKFSITIPLKLIKRFASSEDFADIVNNHILLLKHVQYFITSNNMWRTYPQRFSMQIFLFLLLSIAHHEVLDIKTFNVRLTTQLLMSVGLGSSTSFAVCHAACFLHWARLQKGDHNAFNNQDLILISKYAMQSEEVIQNHVVDIDHYVCTFGQGFIFQHTKLPDGSYRFLNTSEMKILLIDANFYRSNCEQRIRVATLTFNNEDKILFDRNMDVIDDISQKCATTLSEIKNCRNLFEVDALYDKLKDNIKLNQENLYKLELSHQNLDVICTIAKRFGFEGKATNIKARYALILLPPRTPPKHCC